MEIAILVLLIIFTFLLVKRSDLRNQMVFGGIMTIPLLFYKPIISSTSWYSAFADLGFVFWLERLVFGFAFGAIAAALYEAVFKQRFTTMPRDKRSHLSWLLIGPAALLIANLGFEQSFILSLILGLAIDALILIIIRPDLTWDALFSAIAMGSLYLLMFFLLFRGIPGDVKHFWFANQLTGINILGIPIEELVAVALFGGLWGPLYVALKSFREVDTEK